MQPITAGAIVTLAFTKAFEKTIEKFTEAALVKEAHPDVATSLNNLAYLYDSQARYDQAEPLFLQALKIRQQVFGVNHPNTVTVRENLENLQAKKNASRKVKNNANNSWWEKLLGLFE
ncbi:MAG: tetratricopeptide repeat protein [Nostoc sp. DedQUE11]|nr:tetratricopeptide repeat protein [Nostoc sp. DedQUE11]